MFNDINKLLLCEKPSRRDLFKTDIPQKDILLSKKKIKNLLEDLDVCFRSTTIYKEKKKKEKKKRDG